MKLFEGYLNNINEIVGKGSSNPQYDNLTGINNRTFTEKGLNENFAKSELDEAKVKVLFDESNLKKLFGGNDHTFINQLARGSSLVPIILQASRRTTENG